MTDSALIPSMLAEARRALAEHERQREFYVKGLARADRAIEAQRNIIAFLEGARRDPIRDKRISSKVAAPSSAPP